MSEHLLELAKAIIRNNRNSDAWSLLEIQFAKRLIQLQAENARLRGALERIVKYSDEQDTRMIACKALKDTPDD